MKKEKRIVYINTISYTDGLDSNSFPKFSYKDSLPRVGEHIQLRDDMYIKDLKNLPRYFKVLYVVYDNSYISIFVEPDFTVPNF